MHLVLSWSLARAPMGGSAMILHANWRPVAFSVASLTTEKPATCAMHWVRGTVEDEDGTNVRLKACVEGGDKE